MKNKIFQAGRPVIGEKLIGREKIIKPAALDRIMVFSGGHPYYTQLVCREQTQVLIAIAQNVDSLYHEMDIKRVNVSRALRKLTEKGIIRKKGKNYYLTDPMLMYFIRRDILKWDK